MSFSDNWVSRSGDDEKLLPGLEYTQRQLFLGQRSQRLVRQIQTKGIKTARVDRRTRA